MRERDVDHGYAWIVLLFSCLIYLIIAGGVKSFGVLYTELLDYYDAGAGNTAWISSVCMFLFMGLGPISNFLGERYTYRRIIVIGSCINLIGYTASAFVTKMEMLYLTYGVIAGIGYGLIFAPATTIISFYFKKKRSLANGLVVAVSGIGVLCFPYAYRVLIDYYSLHGTLLIMGAVYFHTCAAGMFLRQPSQSMQKKPVTEEETFLNSEKKPVKSSSFLHDAKTRIFKIDLFRIPQFTICFTAICLQAANYAANMVVIPGQIRTLGFGKDNITLSVSLVGASEIIARAFLGWFADLNIISRVRIFMICSFVSGCVPFVLPHLPYLPVVLTYSVLVGAFSGSFGSLMGVIIVDAVGLENYSPAFGLTSLGCGVTFCLSQPIAGWLEDVTGSWGMSFRFVGLVGVLAFLLLLIEPYIERVWCFTSINDKRNVNIKVVESEKLQTLIDIDKTNSFVE